MKQGLIKTSKILIGLLILIPITMLILVRFTDGSFSIGTFYLAYDEIEGVFEYKKTYKLNGNDGPYLFKNEIVTVDDENAIIHSTEIQDTILVKVNNTDKDIFKVGIKGEILNPTVVYDQPQKLIAVSDIEGNFNGFVSLLQKHNVIDENFDWSFGDGHLVLVGDFVDRGNNVIPVLWLIYKLENEAEKERGKVHFIIGNHEIMNIQGNLYYAESKYKKLAIELGKKETNSENGKILFAGSSELGKWLRSKNVVELIGKRIFTHAGLSPEILNYKISLDTINQIVRRNIDKDLYHKPEKDEQANFLMGRKSPFWYRGLVTDYKYYDKIAENELDKVLEYYNAEQIVVGHTVVVDISSEFNGKVVRIDIKHGKEKNSGNTKGILIENGVEYKIDDKGNKETL